MNLSPAAREALLAEAGGVVELAGLLVAVAEEGGYRADLAGSLAGIARSPGAPWGARRVAVAILEVHLALAPPVSPGEMASCAATLGCDVDRARDLLRRLGRLRRIHDRLRSPRLGDEGEGARAARRGLGPLAAPSRQTARPLGPSSGPPIDEGAVLDLLHVARSERRLSLAGCFFREDEVLARIGSLTRASRGAELAFLPEHAEASTEASRAIARLPRYEAAIVRGLLSSPVIWWAAEAPDESIHGLAAYPRSTVVLVIRPPGSDVEIEIKRAGRPAPRPLAVVYRRDGREVPPSHRLDGGSMAEDLQDEAGASALFSAAYRLIHGEEAPLSRTLAIRSIEEIPSGEARIPTLAYFEGEGSKGECLSAFAREDEKEGRGAPAARGGASVTERFLARVAPSQAILLGTSSFRLDRVADDLSSGRAAERSRESARRFADDVLEQVLGVLSPPPHPYTDQDGYVRAALSVAENRARASDAHLRAMESIGRVWGTILGLGGCSHGESLVGRNVGIQCAWTGESWAPGLVFLDHDNLHVGGSPRGLLRPEALALGRAKDRLAVFGGVYKGARLRGSVELLEAIYAVDPEAGAASRAALVASVRRAFTATRRALFEDPRLRAVVSAEVLSSLPRPDTAVESFLRELECGRWDPIP